MLIIPLRDEFNLSEEKIKAIQAGVAAFGQG